MSAFLNFGIIKSSFLKVMIRCFSLYSHKYFKENRSLPVAVSNRIFPTNFNFDKMFVLDFRCISSDTKKSASVDGRNLYPFFVFFYQGCDFFCSVVSLLYVLRSVFFCLYSIFGVEMQISKVFYILCT